MSEIRWVVDGLQGPNPRIIRVVATSLGDGDWYLEPDQGTSMWGRVPESYLAPTKGEAFDRAVAMLEKKKYIVEQQLMALKEQLPRSLAERDDRL